MKFCYVDESGKSTEPILVLAGIVTDAQRMHVTKKDWLHIMSVLARVLKRPIEEFHTRHFYRGNGIWRDLDGNQRTAIMNAILEWLGERSHKIVFSAVEKSKANAADFAERREFVSGGGTPQYWRLAAMHLMLSLQRLHQREEKNKGNTVIVFDRGADEEDVADMALGPPPWTDTFYGYEPVVGTRNNQRPNSEPRLNQIIDVPYFADSRKVGLLQVADLFAYLLRHHAQLQGRLTVEKYEGEAEKVAGWVKRIAGLMTSDSTRWPARGGCPCAKFFKGMAPEPLLRIQKQMAS